MSGKVHLKRIGFFYQLPDADRLHILKVLSRSEPMQDEAAIAEYLESGLRIAFTPGVETDPLLPDAPFAGPLHILTDGLYAWPKTLSYWVSKHHLLLPDTFLEHIRSVAYRVPDNLDSGTLVLD
jgi:hypothetical protein